MNDPDDLKFNKDESSSIFEMIQNEDFTGVAYHMSEKICDFYEYTGEKRLDYTKRVTKYIMEVVINDYKSLTVKSKDEVIEELEKNLQHYTFIMSIYPKNSQELPPQISPDDNAISDVP